MEDQFDKWNDAWSGLFSAMKKAADAIGKLTDTLNDLNYQQALFEAEANFLSSFDHDFYISEGLWFWRAEVMFSLN